MNLRYHFVADVVAGLAVGVLAFLAGSNAYQQSPRQSFYQSEFGPAVMVAAGRGFVNPQPTPSGSLDLFLSRRSEAVDPSRLDIDRIVPINQLQSAHYYLMTAVGLWWRLTSIAWNQLAGVVGLLSAAAAVAVFGLARLFVPVAPAALAALWFATSPLQLGYAPHLRDYAKAPFILAAAAIAVALVIKPMSMRQALLLGAAAGAVIGLGIGFRMDVLIMAPITLACVAVFRGAAPLRSMREKAIICAVFVATLGVTAWPIVSKQSSGGSNSIHVVLLGYSDWFDPMLGIEAAPYSFSPFYSDEYLRSVLRTRAANQHGVDAPMPSAAYDAAGIELWRQWFRHFPADVYTRLLAAVDGVLNLGFVYPAQPFLDGWLPAAWSSPVFEWLSTFTGWGWALGLLLMIAAARSGVSRALFAATLIVALAGYPSLQFDARHYFHLQAIPVCAIVVLCWEATTAIARYIRDAPAQPAVLSIQRRLAVAVGVFAFVMLPVAPVRAYQSWHVQNIVRAIVHGPRQDIQVHFEQQPDGRFIGRWPNMRGDPTRLQRISHSYYVAEFSANAPRDAMTIGLRYAYAPGWVPCAHLRHLQTTSGVARFVFPVFSVDDEFSFEGIELGAEMRGRFTGLYQLPSGPAGLPVHLQLASNWQDRRLYQRLIREERLSPDDTGIAVIPSERCGSDIPIIDATLSPTLNAAASPIAAVHSPDVAIRGDGIRFDGSTKDEPIYLIDWKPQIMNRGDAVVARIWLDRGSLYLALAQNGAWVQYTLVTKPGVSIVTLRPPVRGEYDVQIARGAPGLRPALQFTVDRLGIVRDVSADRTQ